MDTTQKLWKGSGGDGRLPHGMDGWRYGNGALMFFIFISFSLFSLSLSLPFSLPPPLSLSFFPLPKDIILEKDLLSVAFNGYFKRYFCLLAVPFGV